MKATRFLPRALVVTVLAFTISCGTPTPTEVSVAPPPRADLLGSLLKNLGLISCSPLPYDSVTQSIGPQGGTIHVGPHTLRIPAGALSGRTTISAVLPPSRYNLVRFSPQGLQFSQPAQLTMSYGNCSLLGLLLPKHIAYTNDLLQILELIPGIDLLFQRAITAPIHHFSNYAVAW